MRSTRHPVKTCCLNYVLIITIYQQTIFMQRSQRDSLGFGRFLDSFDTACSKIVHRKTTKIRHTLPTPLPYTSKY